MARSTRRRPRRPGVELVKMAVLAKRSAVPTPTIKHYIREGLLPGPAVRTSRNIAYYDGRLAARIQAIKSLQAERFLPLRVIGELLEPSPSAALRSDAVSQRKALTALAPAMAADRSEKRRKRSDVIATESVTRRELEMLEQAGVIELRGAGDSAGYSGSDVDLIELVGELRRAGLGDVFPLSIARAYRDAVERLLALEIELFRRHALGAALPAPLPEIARHAFMLGERVVVALRAKLLPRMLANLAPVARRPTTRGRRLGAASPRSPRR